VHWLSTLPAGVRTSSPDFERLGLPGSVTGLHLGFAVRYGPSLYISASQSAACPAGRHIPGPAFLAGRLATSRRGPRLPYCSAVHRDGLLSSH